MLKLLLAQFQVGVGEPHVGLALHGHQVDVGMRNFQAQYALAYLNAGDGFLNGNGHLLGKYLQAGQLFVGEVEDVVHLALGDDQCMSLLQGADIEECKVLVVLGNLVAGNLAGYDT